MVHLTCYFPLNYMIGSSGKSRSKRPRLEFPKNADIKVGDFIVARYSSSRWAKWLPWENWHHAALISSVNPLKVIETIGPNEAGQYEGPFEVAFEKSAGWEKNKKLPTHSRKCYI